MCDRTSYKRTHKVCCDVYTTHWQSYQISAQYRHSSASVYSTVWLPGSISSPGITVYQALTAPSSGPGNYTVSAHIPLPLLMMLYLPALALGKINPSLHFPSRFSFTLHYNIQHLSSLNGWTLYCHEEKLNKILKNSTQTQNRVIKSFTYPSSM